jgi:hypothetical protein
VQTNCSFWSPFPRVCWTPSPPRGCSPPAPRGRYHGHGPVRRRRPGTFLVFFGEEERGQMSPPLLDSRLRRRARPAAARRVWPPSLGSRGKGGGVCEEWWRDVEASGRREWKVPAGGEQAQSGDQWRSYRERGISVVVCCGWGKMRLCLLLGYTELCLLLGYKICTATTETRYCICCMDGQFRWCPLPMFHHMQNQD